MNNFGEKDKNELLKAMKNTYQEQLEYMNVPKDSNRFSWEGNRKLKFTIIKIAAPDNFGNIINHYLFYAQESNNDTLIYKDLFNETNKFSFRHDNISDEERLQWIINKKIINKPKNIIKASLDSFFAVEEENYINSLIENIKNFATKEFDESNNDLKSKPNDLMIFSDKKYFADTFEFKKVINGVSDAQFTDELIECLWAYNHEKWYLCAAGLGGVLEQLMYLTLMNYNDKSQLKKLGKTPTAHNYLEAFLLQPIGIDNRQYSLINSWFQARNSTSHFNSGLTNKMLCDQMLIGVTSLYDDYYLPSISYQSEKK